MEAVAVRALGEAAAAEAAAEEVRAAQASRVPERPVGTVVGHLILASPRELFLVTEEHLEGMLVWSAKMPNTGEVAVRGVRTIPALPPVRVGHHFMEVLEEVLDNMGMKGQILVLLEEHGGLMLSAVAEREAAPHPLVQPGRVTLSVAATAEGEEVVPGAAEREAFRAAEAGEMAEMAVRLG
jgi:hypothetical protein